MFAKQIPEPERQAPKGRANHAAQGEARSPHTQQGSSGMEQPRPSCSGAACPREGVGERSKPTRGVGAQALRGRQQDTAIIKLAGQTSRPLDF